MQQKSNGGKFFSINFLKICLKLKLYFAPSSKSFPYLFFVTTEHMEDMKARQYLVLRKFISDKIN